MASRLCCLAHAARSDAAIQPALCPDRVRFVWRSPWSIPFPPRTPPPPSGRSCSSASQVLRNRPTPRKRAWRTHGLHLLLPSLAVIRQREFLGSPGSRVWSFHACTGSSTPPRHPIARQCAMRSIAFPNIRQGRHAKWLISELHGWPACSRSPCYTRSVATPSVGVRAKWLARPYSYEFFHSLLQTGLSRRLPNGREYF